MFIHGQIAVWMHYADYIFGQSYTLSKCTQQFTWYDISIQHILQTGLLNIHFQLSLITRGKIPKKNDVIKTIYGILQSTAFLSGTGFGYSAIVCLLR